jgi:hypothetical protein
MEEELPWWTEEELKRAAKELHFLKQLTATDEKQMSVYRDIYWMYFKRQVLDKYRNSEYCDIGDEYIHFLSYDKSKPEDSIAHFINRDFDNIKDVLMVQAQEFINVPPRQRSHWQHYEIEESEIQFK